MSIEELTKGLNEVLSLLQTKYPKGGPLRWNETLNGFLFADKGLWDMTKQLSLSALWGQTLHERADVIDIFEKYRQSLIELIKLQNNINIQNKLISLKDEYWSLTSR